MLQSYTYIRVVTSLLMVVAAAMSFAAQVPEVGKYYSINRFSLSNAYITQSGSTLTGSTFSADANSIWTFERGASESTFYIRNAKTGDYIQSTNISLSTKVQMGQSPVDFAVIQDTKTGSSTKGYYVFASTDQTVDITKKGTLGLNFQSGTATIVSYYCQSGTNKNSFFELHEVEFDPSEISIPHVGSMAEVSEAEAYQWITPSGQVLAYADGKLTTVSPRFDKNTAWVMVGKNKDDSGVIMVNLSQPGRALKMNADGSFELADSAEATKWKWDNLTDEQLRAHVAGDATKTLFSDTALTLTYTKFPTEAKRSLQIYTIPCSNADSVILAECAITGDDVIRPLQYTNTSTSAVSYDVCTSRPAAVSQGRKFLLTVRFLHADAFHTTKAFFDWDRDGSFETPVALPDASNSVTVDVPADALTGKTRMRIVSSATGAITADEDVIGTAYDFPILVEEPQTQRTVAVTVNDTLRGTATIELDGKLLSKATVDYGTRLTLKAHAINGATFLYWKAGAGSGQQLTDSVLTMQAVSTDTYEAVFTPATTAPTGITTPAAKAATWTHRIAGGRISVSLPQPARRVSLSLYSIDGKLMAKSKSLTLRLPGQVRGQYILRVSHDGKDESKTILINKL
jgi:hypothetical protein